VSRGLDWLIVTDVYQARGLRRQGLEPRTRCFKVSGAHCCRTDRKTTGYLHVLRAVTAG
jgi:hypothetical protein